VIRPATEADASRVAELMSLNRMEPITAEGLLDHDRHFPRGGVNRYLVVDLPGDGIVCFGRAQRWPNQPRDLRKWTINVDPAFRRRGYAQAIMEALHEPEVARLRVEVRDTDAESLGFAQRRGFEQTQHVFESIIDLIRFDDEAFDEIIRCAEANGVRFFSYAETAMDEEALRRLWAVNEETGVDEPGSDGEAMSFEDWSLSVGQARWFAPKGQIVAAVGDEWVGLGAVGELTPGRFYNLYTGVRRPHRGKGIAKALKALGLRYARAQGGLTLRTHNNSTNGPMLAINRSFGYQPLPGLYTLEKEISIGTR
jgi:mycothiol synthase